MFNKRNFRICVKYNCFKNCINTFLYNNCYSYKKLLSIIKNLCFWCLNRAVGQSKGNNKKNYWCMFISMGKLKFETIICL